MDKLDKILYLIKDNMSDLVIINHNTSDKALVIDAIDNLLYSVVEYKKEINQVVKAGPYYKDLIPSNSGE